MVKGIRHFGIVSNNLKKDIDFYTILGFTRSTSGTLTAKETKKLIGIDSILTYTKLILNSNKTQRIELYEFAERQHFYQNQTHHLAFTVESIKEVYKKLQEIGIKFVSNPVFDKEKKHKLCFCRDFSYNLIELVEEIK
jgi:catechol 2,3-dioxygenase-like lactoylglutathione lyase family enzyme